MSEPTTNSESLADTAELWAALQCSLGERLGAGRRIIGLQRRLSDYRSTFALEELDVALDDGASLRLMFKDLGRRAVPGAVRQGAKPEFLREPRREIETYRKILAQQELGTATCYGAVSDRQTDRYWLFLEKVPGKELYRVGELSAWQEAARWLARLHTSMADDAARLALRVPLVRHDVDYFRIWIRRALAMHSWAGEDDTRRSRFRRLAGRYDEIAANLAALPATFIHGEFYASNVLVQQTPGGWRVWAVDWESAALGPGLIDLAALVAGRWTEQERTALVHAYHAALNPEAAPAPPPASFLTALEFCRLHLAVQWLGWSADWSPPAEQAQDWLGEALELVEKLEL